jgi:hypothetical protein
VEKRPSLLEGYSYVSFVGFAKPKKIYQEFVEASTPVSAEYQAASSWTSNTVSLNSLNAVFNW